MPKFQKHADKPYDGAIWRALRSSAALGSTVYAKRLSDLSGYRVSREHISGYEKGERLIPDALIEASARIFSETLGKNIDPMLFPEYAARQFSAEVAMDAQKARTFIAYTQKFSAQRKTLFTTGTQLADTRSEAKQ